MRQKSLWMAAICMVLCLCFCKKASAADSWVYDQAHLLTAEEVTELEKRASEMKDAWNMNFLVVTVDDTEGKSTREYGDDFYDACFPEDSEEDGILYLIDMDHRELYISTCGEAIRYLTDERIDAILDQAFRYAGEGAYYRIFLTFFDSTENYLNKGIPSDQYNYDTETGERTYYKKPRQITTAELLVALGAALAASLAVCLGIVGKYQLKFEDFHYDAYTDSQVTLSVNEDRPAGTIVTHRRIPRNQGSAGMGGSASSVHHSSGGRSHGGGGRRF